MALKLSLAKVQTAHSATGGGRVVGHGGGGGGEEVVRRRGERDVGDRQPCFGRGYDFWKNRYFLGFMGIKYV